MSEIKYDLPEGFFDAGTLLDANHGFYQLSENLPGANVYVELHAARKGAVFTPELGTFSSTHTTARLIKQDNYNDIGGGIMTYQRHFADVPLTQIRGDSLRRNRINVVENVSITGDVSRVVSLQFGQLFATDRFFGQTTILSLAQRITYIDVDPPLLYSVVDFFNFFNVVFGNATLYNRTITYDGATPYVDLSDTDKRIHRCEKLEILHADSSEITAAAYQGIRFLGSRAMGLQIFRSTLLAFTAPTTITLGTHTLTFEGTDYELFNGVITATQA